ncbi:uncharacterized protein K444DRAFT_528369, partial [Hyaloscypha bicolor E]
PFSVLKLSLVTFPLDKTPPYDAVSYTWGRQVRNKTLYLDDGILKTTRNVSGIAGNRATWEWPNWLWINAVCINRDDLDEQPGKLRLMGDIYRSASRVLAWLDYEEVSLLDLTLISILSHHFW